MMVNTTVGVQRRTRRVGIVASMIVCLALVIAGCGGSATVASDVQSTSSNRAYQLLGNSVRATGKILSRTNAPAQLKGASSGFSRQLDPVDEALAHLASNQSDLPEDERDALTKAARTHRKYVSLLIRATALPAKQGRSVLNQARKAGGQTRDAYQSLHRDFPQSPDVLSGVDLTDTLGLAAAMGQVIKRERDEAAAKQRDEAAAKQRAQTPSTPAPSGSAPPSGVSTSGCVSSGGDSRSGPVVSCVKASVSGGMVTATMSYCDRTPGGKQSFRYSFTLYPAYGDTPVDVSGSSAVQSYACRDISSGAMGPVTSGVAYVVYVTVYNDSAGVSGTGMSNTFAS